MDCGGTTPLSPRGHVRAPLHTKTMTPCTSSDDYREVARAARNLDHLFYTPSPNELMKYRSLGTEVICGRPCVIYSSRQRQSDKMWVDAATGFVFKRHSLEVSPNPRIVPRVRDWQLLSFHS